VQQEKIEQKTNGESKFNILDQLSPKEREIFDKLRNRIYKDLKDDIQKEFCNDICLVRYLRARDFDISKSEPLLRDSLKWRFEDFKPHLISPEEVAEEGVTGKNYVSTSRDKLGRPILYMKPRFENTKNYKLQLRLLIYHMDRTCAHMDESNGISQWVWIIDYKEYSMKNAPPMSTAMETLSLLSNHYPERLGAAFLIEPPFLFSLMWKAVSPFVPPATHKKIHFVSGKDHDRTKYLLQHFDVDQLESDYGGNIPTAWDAKVYWEKEAKDYADRLTKWGITKT